MSAQNIFETLGEEFNALLAPLLALTEKPEAFPRFLNQMGWFFPEWEPSPPFGTLVGAIEDLIDGIEAIQAGLTTESLEDILTAIQDLSGALAALETLYEVLEEGISASVSEEIAAELGLDTFNVLVLGYLQERAPLVYEILRLLVIIEYEVCEALTITVDAEEITVRRPTPRYALRLSNLKTLLMDPGVYLRGAYLVDGTLDGSAQARLFVVGLFRPLRMLFARLGGYAWVGPDALSVTEAADASNEVLTRTAIVGLPLPGELGALDSEAALEVEIVVLSAEDTGALGLPGPAIEFTPQGLASASGVLGDWTLTLSVEGDVGTFYVSPSTFELEGASGADLYIAFSALKGSGEGAAFIFGASEGTRLELGEVALSADTRLSASSVDYGFGVAFNAGALVLSAGDGDSFIANVLPEGGLEIPFDFGLLWSKSAGLRLSGGLGLEARLPIDLTLFGVLEIPWIDVGLSVDEDGLALSVGLTGTLEIGPLVATVENIGLSALFDFPADQDGNLGPVDVALAFKPPSGLGLSVNVAGVVTGGGYLYVDAAAGEYAGVAQLEILALGITAIGILNTRLEGGGWSLFLSIMADFTPIQLGFGFTLNGVGGFIGIHRTFDEIALAEGLSEGILDSLMFPEDPIADAARILADADAVFPNAEGSFVFGPMVELGWGTPSLITAQLGLVIALPDLEIAVLGQVEMILPTPSAPILELHMSVAGYINVSEGIFWIQAAIHDSKIIGIDLSGDMAMYLSVGSDPFFLLSVGGFHPDFDPPASLPSSMTDLSRMKASLEIGSAIEIRIETYFALTSNTLQLGAALYLEASAKVVGITFAAEGWLSFDALLIYDPFSFQVDMSAGVAITAAGKELMGVSLDLYLEGPKPWYANGRAEFRMLGFDIKFPIEVGSPNGTAVPEPYNVRADLIAALQAPESWGASTATGSDEGAISLRDLEESEAGLWLRPEGKIEVRQRVAPLNQTLERYGHYVPEGGDTFNIDAAGFGTETSEETSVLQDHFAPAQFKDLGDAKKLSSPSFELMDCGLSYGGEGVSITSEAAERAEATVDYEQVVYVGEERLALGSAVLTRAKLSQALSSSRAARAARRAGGIKRYAVSGTALEIAPQGYTVVGAETAEELAEVMGDLTLADDGGSRYSNASAALSTYLKDHPSQRSQLRVVPVHDTWRTP